MTAARRWVGGENQQIREATVEPCKPEELGESRLSVAECRLTAIASALLGPRLSRPALRVSRCTLGKLRLRAVQIAQGHLTSRGQSCFRSPTLAGLPPILAGSTQRPIKLCMISKAAPPPFPSRLLETCRLNQFNSFRKRKKIVTTRLDSRSTCDNERPLLGPPSLRVRRVDHGQSELYLPTFGGSTFSSGGPTTKTGRCLRVSGAAIYKQIEKIQPFPPNCLCFQNWKLARSSDSIRCGLEVKIVEPKNSAHTVQDQLLSP